MILFLHFKICIIQKSNYRVFYTCTFPLTSLPENIISIALFVVPQQPLCYSMHLAYHFTHTCQTWWEYTSCFLGHSVPRQFWYEPKTYLLSRMNVGNCGCLRSLWNGGYMDFINGVDQEREYRQLYYISSNRQEMNPKSLPLRIEHSISLCSCGALHIKCSPPFLHKQIFSTN